MAAAWRLPNVTAAAERGPKAVELYYMASGEVHPVLWPIGKLGAGLAFGAFSLRFAPPTDLLLKRQRGPCECHHRDRYRTAYIPAPCSSLRRSIACLTVDVRGESHCPIVVGRPFSESSREDASQS